MVLLCNVASIVLTCVICYNNISPRKRWMRWLLLTFTTVTALLGISSLVCAETRVKGEQFRHSWSSYSIWLAVGIFSVVNIPALYLVSFRRRTSKVQSIMLIPEFERMNKSENGCVPVKAPTPH